MLRISGKRSSNTPSISMYSTSYRFYLHVLTSFSEFVFCLFGVRERSCERIKWLSLIVRWDLSKFSIIVFVVFETIWIKINVSIDKTVDAMIVQTVQKHSSLIFPLKIFWLFFERWRSHMHYRTRENTDGRLEQKWPLIVDWNRFKSTKWNSSSQSFWVKVDLQKIVNLRLMRIHFSSCEILLRHTYSEDFYRPILLFKNTDRLISIKYLS